MVEKLIEDDAEAHALREIGPAAADTVPDLTAALKGPKIEVQWYAADALGKIGLTAVPYLVAALKDLTAEVR